MGSIVNPFSGPSEARRGGIRALAIVFFYLGLVKNTSVMKKLTNITDLVTRMLFQAALHTAFSFPQKPIITTKQLFALIIKSPV